MEAMIARKRTAGGGAKGRSHGPPAKEAGTKAVAAGLLGPLPGAGRERRLRMDSSDEDLPWSLKRRKWVAKDE